MGKLRKFLMGIEKIGTTIGKEIIAWTRTS
nr:MAG TPA: hypothetical protein [Caudoviricetes sp.]